MRVGTVCFNTRQGIGWLPKWFRDAGIIHETMIFRHGSRKQYPEWYPLDTVELVGRPFNGPQVAEFLGKIDVLLQFETPFDWEFVNLCRKCGVKTVLVPMYECTPKVMPAQFDKIICPSLLDCEYFPGSPFLQIPCPPVKWEERTVINKFLHSGGNLGLRGHKGTKKLLEAMKYVKSNVDLTVRAQDSKGLSQIIREVRGISQDKRVTFDVKDYAWEDLYTGFDILIQPESRNGLSLPLMEARGSGLVVCTSNIFPHNTWLPDWPLIPVESYSKAQIGGAYLEHQEANLNPEDIAATIDRLHRQCCLTYSGSGKQWAEQNSWANLKDSWLKELAN